MVFRTVILLLLLIPITNGFAQEDDCEQVLVQASDEFNAGHFSVVPSMVEKCLPSFTKEQSLRANLLLVQTYLLLDDSKAAQECYLNILKINPEFRVNERDHNMDVVYLSKKFIVAPIFSWFVKSGVNTSPIQVIHDLNAFGNSTATEEYKMKLGYQLNLGIDYYFNRHFALKGELSYARTQYEHLAANFFGVYNKQVHDSQHWIGVPISFVYQSNSGKCRPYGYIGYSAYFLLRDLVDITISKVDEFENKSDLESANINFTNRRNRFNSSVHFGAGVNYKIRSTYLFVDVRYSVGLKNLIKANALYGNYSYDPLSKEFLDSFSSGIAFAHVEDYFRLDNLSVSIGVMKPIFKPRVIKR